MPSERAVLMSTSEQIHAADLGLEADKAAPGKIEDMSLEEVENSADQESPGAPFR